MKRISLIPLGVIVFHRESRYWIFRGRKLVWKKQRQETLLKHVQQSDINLEGGKQTCWGKADRATTRPLERLARLASGWGIKVKGKCGR